MCLAIYVHPQEASVRNLVYPCTLKEIIATTPLYVVVHSKRK